MEYLEGYWEIKEAKTPHNKTHKEYKFNETIDFISLDGKTGNRKKVKPTIDGKYKVTKSNESFQIDNSEDTLKLKYKTKYDEWEEYVIELNKDKLVILNEEKIRYTYKRYSNNIDFNEK
ncbi:MAG: lipocalin family protein [Bacteroidota bacterium]